MSYCQNTLEQAEQKIRLLQQDALRDFHPAPGSES
jgi:exonuclease VII small subunit